MKHRFNAMRPIFIILITVLTSISFAGCQCQYGDPGVSIRLNNLTDQTLIIFIDELQEYDIPSGKVLAFDTTLIYPKNIYPVDKKFLIEAKTQENDVVYSEEFTWQELDDMDWKIVISLSED